MSRKWKWKGKWKPLPFLVGAAVIVAGMWIRGPLVPGQEKVPGEDPEKRHIRVEVLNGSGVTRAGQGLAEHLRELGFDVVDIDNADRADYRETLVLDRAGIPEYAQTVARRLGVEHVAADPDEELLLEVTVILGRDLAKNFRGGFR